LDARVDDEKICEMTQTPNALRFWMNVWCQSHFFENL